MKSYEDMLREEAKEREKQATDPKHLKDGLSSREPLCIHGINRPERVFKHGEK